MLNPPLPKTIDNFNYGDWSSFEPYFEALKQGAVHGDTDQWLKDWSDLSIFIHESYTWLMIQKSLDTNDKAIEKAYFNFIENVYGEVVSANQALNLLLLDKNIDDANMALMIKKIENQVSLFRAENIEIDNDLNRLGNEYDKHSGNLSVDWDGEKKNLNRLTVDLRSSDAATAERAWRAISELWLSVREPLDALFAEMLPKRVQLAKNAGFDNFRDFSFRRMGRFAYTPADSAVFHEAIADVVVPAVSRILEKKRRALGVDVLKPWHWVSEMGNFIVDTSDAPPLTPFKGQAELVAQTRAIFNKMDEGLGRAFGIMDDEGLLDLDTRDGKSLGGYCASLPLRGRPYIFMNAVGTHDNVQTMLHEAGHAFHVFEAMDNQPLYWQRRAPMEFNEVASMAMEFLALPYLTKDQGGFYDEAEAARAKIEHLESTLLFFPFMAVVDSFQHWIYTHAEEALDSANLDAAWDRLWQRFLPGLDWSGHEDTRMSGWHRKPHIFRSPFYYIEYGMAQVGALQVWRNSLENPQKALADYHRALSLGGTVSLPELYEAAGVEFRFDEPMLRDLVALIEETVEELEGQI